LQGLIPEHVPKVLGTYEGRVKDGYLVEEIHGSPLETRTGQVKAIPNEEQINRFFNALRDIAEDNILIEIDSFNPHNLALGRIGENENEEIIMYEPNIRESIDIEWDKKFLLDQIQVQEDKHLRRAREYNN